MSNNISVIILTKNSSLHISDCLNALEDFNEIIIIDNGSSDDTLDIAKTFNNVVVYTNEFIGFGALKNLAISHTNNDWLLAIDSDEILSAELNTEIHQQTLDNNCIYNIKRHNYYNGKHLNCCGWDNDWVLRLFNKNSTKFNDNQVHESLITGSLKQQKLTNHINHYPYQDTNHLLAKLQHYSSLWAQDKHKQNRNSSIIIATTKAIFAFIKFYIIKKGFLNGNIGLLISSYNAHHVFYKYAKLAELNLKNKGKSLY